MSNPSNSLQPDSKPIVGSLEVDSAFELELAGLMVEALNLDVEPVDIDPLDPLYDGPLGLDSIDFLEIALTVSKRYQVELRAEDDQNHAIFQSLRSLSSHVRLSLPHA